MLEHADINERLLPPQLRRLVGAIGVAGTVKLLRARGGTRLWLPQRGEASEILVELLGRTLAAQLVDAFPGERVLSLPKLDKISAQMRDSAIRAEHAEGVSYAVLALRYDLTERQVLNIVKSEGRLPVWRDPNRDLFGGLG